MRYIEKKAKTFFWGISLSVLSFDVGCSRVTETSDVKASGVPVGGYKGYAATQKIVATRLFDGARDSFSFIPYLGNGISLLKLLGSFENLGSTSSFENSTPNAMNMLLWQIIFSGLSKDIAKSCGDSSIIIGENLKFNYNSNFANRLGALCTWPDAKAKSEANLLNLWLAVQGFDAPRQEFESWRNFFLSPDSPYANATYQEAIKAMLMTMFLTPDFLLEH
jgi:hypothetical protein